MSIIKCIFELIQWAVIIVVMWGIVFGITMNGNHYGCGNLSCSQGVVLNNTTDQLVQEEVIIIDTIAEESLLFEDELVEAVKATN